MELLIKEVISKIDSKIDSFDPVIIDKEEFKEYKRIAKKFFRFN